MGEITFAFLMNAKVILPFLVNVKNHFLECFISRSVNLGHLKFDV